MNRAGVRAAEHLKGWVSEIVDKFHEGCVNGAEAKLLIWDEIQATLVTLKPKHFADVLWMRVATPGGDPEAARIVLEIASRGDVLSSRYIGPREDEGEGVFYIVVSAGNIHKAAEIVDCLVNEGYSVRDWSYGANRR